MGLNGLKAAGVVVPIPFQVGARIKVHHIFLSKGLHYGYSRCQLMMTETMTKM
jgi:hypothetical protein